MVADNIGIELKMKRITSTQIHRANPIIQDCSIEHYYCVTIFLPYIDFYITQLTERFINHKTIFKGNYTIFWE